MRKNTSSKDNGFQPRRGEIQDMCKNTRSQDKGSNQGKDMRSQDKGSNQGGGGVFRMLAVSRRDRRFERICVTNQGAEHLQRGGIRAKTQSPRTRGGAARI
jgi:hypothetical protein